MSQTADKTSGLRDRIPKSLAGDLIGGFNAALLGIPYGMGIGIAAFAPLGPDFAAEAALIGVLGAICSALFIPILGGTKGMAAGPRVATALMIAGTLSQIAALGLSLSLGTSLLIIFTMLALAGVFQFLFGILRIGSLVKYTPYPVIAGIITGAGVLLALAQLRLFFEFPAGGLAAALAEGARPLFGAIMVGTVTAALAWYIPRRWPKLPGMPFAVAGGTALHHALIPLADPAQFGKAVGAVDDLGKVVLAPLTEIWALIVGGAPAGLFSAPVMLAVLVGALLIALLAVLDTLLGLLTIDGLTQGRSNADRELAVHGMANVLTALAGGFIGAGAPARIIASYKAGGRTHLASITSASCMAMLVLAAPGVLAYLPKSVVGGLLVTIGIELIDKWTLARIREMVKTGILGNRSIAAEVGIVMIVTLAAATMGLVAALVVGVLISIVIMVARLNRSLIRRIYRGTHVHSRRQRDRRSMDILAEQGSKIAVLELEGPIFFNSADRLEGIMDRLRADGIRMAILDMKRVTEIDVTGARTLENLYRRMTNAGVFIALSYLAQEKRRAQSHYSGGDRRQYGRVRKVWLTLEQLGILRTIGPDHIFPDVDSALGECENRILGGDGRSGARDALERRAVVAMFRGFTAQDIRVLRRHARKLSWRRGEIIFNEGDRGDGVYLLAKGHADVMIRVPGGERGKRVDTLTPGSVFGEMAVLDDKPRAAGIVAATAAMGYCIKAEDFAALKRQNPQIALKILSNLCLIVSGRVRAANRMIVELEG